MTFPPAFWILVITGFIGIFLLVYERKHRRIERSFRSFPLTITALLIWIFSYALEIGFTDKSLMLIAANIQFIGIASVPYLLNKTMRQFMGQPVLRRRFTIISSIIPIITVFLAFTDPVLGLLRRNLAVVQDSGMVQLDVQYGLWHNAVFVPYQYLFYLATLFLLLDSAIKAQKAFRARLFAFASVILLPMLGATLYILNIEPFNTFNPTSVLIMVSFVVFGATMIRHHNLDVVPVARERILDTLDEAILVLDLEDRIVEFNEAASGLFWDINTSVIGLNFVETLGKYDALLLLARGLEDSDARFTFEQQGKTKHYMGKASPVIGFDGTRIGRVITVSDISDCNPGSDNGESEIAETRQSFFRNLKVELERASKFQRPLHIFALLFPEDSSRDRISSVFDTLKTLLFPWEIQYYSGSGHFFILIPESDKDNSLLRARELSRGLLPKFAKMKIGIAGVNGMHNESPRELAARALAVATDSLKGIAYQN